VAIAIDSSTPALATANTGNVATTASFTPPSGAVLAAFAWHDTSGGNTTNSSAVTDSQSSTWSIGATRAKPDSGAQNGHVQVSTAVPAASTATTVTTTGTSTGGSLAAGIYCAVLTGCDTTTPIDAIAEGSSASAVISQLLTTVTVDALVMLINSDWNVAAAPTPAAGETTIVGTGLGAGPDMRIWLVRLTALKNPAGAVTMASTAPTSGNTNNWVAVAFRPAGGGSTPISIGDAGSEAEALTVTAAAPLADTASGAQALAVSAAVSLADGGSAVDALVAGIAISLADTGTAADSLTVTVAVPLADTGAAAQALIAAAAVPLADAGAGGQALTAAVAVPLTDTAAAAEALTVAAALALADAAAAVEAVAVTATVLLGQASAGSDSLTVDTGGGGTTKQLTDGGHAADALCVCKRVLRPSTGTVTRPSTGTVTRPNTGTVEYCSCCT
jgi:hypothetical protein